MKNNFGGASGIRTPDLIHAMDARQPTAPMPRRQNANYSLPDFIRKIFSTFVAFLLSKSQTAMAWFVILVIEEKDCFILTTNMV